MSINIQNVWPDGLGVQMTAPKMTWVEGCKIKTQWVDTYKIKLKKRYIGKIFFFNNKGKFEA